MDISDGSQALENTCSILYNNTVQRRRTLYSIERFLRANAIMSIRDCFYYANLTFILSGFFPSFMNFIIYCISDLFYVESGGWRNGSACLSYNFPEFKTRLRYDFYTQLFHSNYVLTWHDRVRVPCSSRLLFENLNIRQQHEVILFV